MMATQTALLDELVPVAGRRIVDVGCGDGWLVRRLAQRGGTIVGVDPAEGALAAAEAAPSVSTERYVRAGAEALPLADGSWDAAIFFNSLHHVPVEHMDAALSEAARVCRDDGLVFVQEPLAEGPLFELMRPLDDETAVRAAAQAALDRAAARSRVVASQRSFTPVVNVPSFEHWSAHQVLVDPGRAGALQATDHALRDRFAALGRRGRDGWSFDAPARITVLRRG